MEAAQFALEQGLERACVDNLFSACELASKARLILHDGAVANVKSHQPIHSKINLWGHLGNVEQSFLSLFNSLSNLRTPARYYGVGHTSMPSTSAIEIVQREIEILKQAVQSRIDDADVDQESKAVKSVD